MMKYTREELIERIKQGEKVEFLYFWGHQPQKDGKIGPSCFSQWWLSDFKDESYNYSSAEQYMMAGKAKLFGDFKILEKITETTSPKEV